MPTLHASCVILGRAGVLIRGASGAGKSRLVAMLLADAERRGRFGRLVADDRVEVSARHGRLIARPPGPIAGLMEFRFLGIARLPYESATVVRVIIDLVPADGIERLLETDALTTYLFGIGLAHLVAPSPEVAAERMTFPCAPADGANGDCFPLAFALQHGKDAPSYRAPARPECKRGSRIG